MKNRAIIGLLICVVLVCSCFGCNKQPEIPREKELNAETLWNKINETMTGLDSFKVNVSMELAFMMQGLCMQGEMDADVICATIDRQPYVYEAATTRISCEDIDYQEKSKEIRAYYDGKMYLADETPNYTRRLCSEMTHEAFAAYVGADKINLSNIDLMDCTDKKITEQENEWLLQFSGYTKKSINALIKSAGMEDLNLDRALEDMKIMVVADDQFRVKSMDVEMIFTEEEQDNTLFKASTQYSDYNQTQDNREVLMQETYTEVDDLYSLKKVEEFLEAFTENESGACHVTSKMVEKFGRSVREYTEEGQITFAREKNHLSYEMKGTMNNQQEFHIVYKDGVQTVAADEEVQENLLAEDKAASVLEALLNPCGFDTRAVENITLSKIDEYKFTMAYCGVNMEQYYTSLKGKMEAVSQDVYVTLEGDKVIRIRSEIHAAGVIYSQKVQYTQTNIIEYQ